MHIIHISCEKLNILYKNAFVLRKNLTNRGICDIILNIMRNFGTFCEYFAQRRSYEVIFID